ncbi:hypothetical protein [Cognatishimia sp. F0-27]|uniref:hypothetical protein n=1 Tax=Cognatishimia sp. F0-27 TaxID=2816855 RepID=UPI001D0C4761|nr:hypothetical protein [Cognatishimia sp. F0-27]MCC1494571.1 hypothetical protein [Cognatishimia sp. F0-27]
MAQEPATPKGRRVLLRAAAAVSGSLATRLPMADSERAALALRQALPARRRPAEDVRFLIPLVGPHHVSDWSAVTQRLNATVQSFLDQDDPRWQAVICCQTRPAGLPDDPRITHLPFDDPTSGNDKWRKLAALCAHLPTLSDRPGYAMSFDADDLLRKGTVARMLSSPERGWLARSGYVMDHATGDVALADSPTPSLPLRKPFWKLCGSCAALWYDPTLPEATDFLTAMTAHEHRMFPHLAALAGLPLTPLPRPSVLYVLNHGDNFGARRGRVGFKTRFVQRFRVTDPAALRTIKADFPAS